MLIIPDLNACLTQRIDAGLAQSRFGVVILSKRFLEKPWPQRELRGLVSREIASGVKVILPVWHEISEEDVIAASPPLASVLAVSTSRGLDHVVEQILKVVKPSAPSGSGNRSGKTTASLDGDYLVVGFDPTGSQYRGRATIKVHEGVLVIASVIGPKTYICQGRLKDDMLNVYGDFEVEYIVKPDGTLVGTWGKGGIETLTPIEDPIGSKGSGTLDNEVRPR
jgi:hypothetical protein